MHRTPESNLVDTGSFSIPLQKGPRLNALSGLRTQKVGRSTAVSISPSFHGVANNGTIGEMGALWIQGTTTDLPPLYAIIWLMRCNTHRQM